MAHKYYLSLNKPALLFFPSTSREINHGLDGAKNHVVMVTIKARQHNIAKEMSTFYFLQYEITKVIESIVLAHISIPLPPEVVVRGKGYALSGKRKPWKYGRSLKLGWGEEQIHASAEKWIFAFELLLEEKGTEGNMEVETLREE
ncbi:hypothetical protein BJ912DRAFT_67170 [Pholiota molesta]|nr:hypothetical protein BJ912DRAFT_67170 [Pholiota molesta]